MSNKEEYKIYCESRPDIPLFSQYWWMDAACKGMTWDVLLYKNASGEIIAKADGIITVVLTIPEGETEFLNYYNEMTVELTWEE